MEKLPMIIIFVMLIPGTILVLFVAITHGKKEKPQPNPDIRTLAERFYALARANGFPDLEKMDTLINHYEKNAVNRLIYTVRASQDGYILDFVPGRYIGTDLIGYFHNGGNSVVFIYDDDLSVLDRYFDKEK